MTAVWFLLSMRGRIGRGPLWLVAVFLVGAPFLVGFVGLAVVRVLGVSGASLDFGLVALTVEGAKADITTSPWTAILLLPTAIRRLHDRGHSGWRLAAFACVHVVFYLLAEAAGALAEGRASVSPPLPPSAEPVLACVQAVCQLAAVAVAAWCFVELACLSGTIGDNPYGPDPRRPIGGGEPIARPTSP